MPSPPPDFAGKGIEAAPGPLQRSDPAKRGSGHWSPLVVFAVVRAVGATPSSWGGTLQRSGKEASLLTFSSHPSIRVAVPPPDFAGKGIEAAPGPLQRSDPAKRGSGHWSPLVVFAVVRAVGATPSSWGGTLQRQGCWGKRI